MSAETAVVPRKSRSKDKPRADKDRKKKKKKKRENPPDIAGMPSNLPLSGLADSAYAAPNAAFDHMTPTQAIAAAEPKVRLTAEELERREQEQRDAVSRMELAAMLEEIGLGEYIGVFEEEEISLNDLFEFDKEEFEDLLPVWADRMRLMDKVNELKVCLLFISIVRSLFSNCSPFEICVLFSKEDTPIPFSSSSWAR